MIRLALVVLTVVVVVWGTADPLPPSAPTPGPAPVIVTGRVPVPPGVRCFEDDTCTDGSTRPWNCATDGNRICGRVTP